MSKLNSNPFHDLLASCAIAYSSREQPRPQPEGHIGVLLVAARLQSERSSSYSIRLVFIASVGVALLVAICCLPTVTTHGQHSPHHVSHAVSDTRGFHSAAPETASCAHATVASRRRVVRFLVARSACLIDPILGRARLPDRLVSARRPSRLVGRPMPAIRLQEVRAGAGSDEDDAPEDDPATCPYPGPNSTFCRLHYRT